MLTAYFPSVYTKGMNSSYITALPDDWERVARVFSAMGDATRQKILLLFEPGESISLSSLVATVGLSRTAVSHHVNVLVRAGLLIPRRQGREVLYRRDLPLPWRCSTGCGITRWPSWPRSRATVPDSPGWAGALAGIAAVHGCCKECA